MEVKDPASGASIPMMGRGTWPLPQREERSTIIPGTVRAGPCPGAHGAGPCMRTAMTGTAGCRDRQTAWGRYPTAMTVQAD